MVPGLRYAIEEIENAARSNLSPVRHQDKAEFAVRLYKNFDGDRFGDYLELPHDQAPTMGSFSPDGSKVVTVDFAGTAYVWDAQTGKHLRTFGRPRPAIEAAIFDPTGQFILTTDWYTISLLNSDTGKEVLTLRGDQPFLLKPLINGLFGRPYQPFSPDGEWIAVVSNEGSVRKWPVDPLRVAQDRHVRELTLAEKELFGTDDKQ